MSQNRFRLVNTENSYPTYLLHSPQEPAGSLGFQLASIGFHALLAASTFFLAAPPPKKEPIEIEIEMAPTLPQPAVRGRANVIASTAPAEHPIVKEPTKVSKPSAPPRPLLPPPSKFEQSESVTESPSVDLESAAQALVEDLDADLDEIAQESDDNLAAARNELESEADALAEESDIAIDDLKRLQSEREAKLASENAARRQKALVQEMAQARYRSEAEAKRRRAAQAEAEAAAMAAAEANAKRNAQAAASTSNGVVAHGGQIRSLEQLRQQPGNKRPRYDIDDRMAKREGPVTIVAFVADNGSIQKLKLVQSSGHQSLDQKTINAIKSWKFYPGQAGWVEIPIVWNLKGGPQERPTQLRRKFTLNSP